MRQRRFAAVYSLIVVLSIAVIPLASCTPLRATVNTAAYVAPPQQATFFIISSDSLSLTERNISALIEAKMAERGYIKAASSDVANIGVLYKYSIDSSGSLHSEPDFVVGGHATYTTFPRHFQIAVIDLEKSKLPEKVEFIWQGELYSSGTSRNISWLAPHFIEALFEHYGKTVTNKGFSKLVE